MKGMDSALFTARAAHCGGCAAAVGEWCCVRGSFCFHLPQAGSGYRRQPFRSPISVDRVRRVRVFLFLWSSTTHMWSTKTKI